MKEKLEEMLKQKNKDLMYSDYETKVKCYYCRYNYEKVKESTDLIISCGKDQFKFIHLYNNFNDSFLIKNIALYCDAVNRDSKEYCKKWISEFKEYKIKLNENGAL